MHRFFLDPTIIKNPLNFPEQTAHQISRVLRLHEGDSVIVLDNQGNEFLVKLDLVKGVQVSGQITETNRNQVESALSLNLYIGFTQREKFEWILQKGTELGVSAFYPMVTKRSLVQKTDVEAKKQNRWQRIVQEASEQSNRGLIPLVNEPIHIKQALQMIKETNKPAWMLWTKEKSLRIREACLNTFGKSTAEKQELNLFIGPEGGFAPEEVEKALESGLQPVSLGKRILRMETAAIVGTALVLSSFDDLVNREN